MARRTIGFKLGIITSAIHLLCVILAYASFIKSPSSTAGLVFIPFFVLDAPIQFLLTMLSVSVLEIGVASPLIVYGFFGSLMWFATPWLADRISTRLFPKGSPIMKWIGLTGMMPLVIVGFLPLSSLATSLSIRQERPVELKESLASPTTGYLAKRVIYQDNAFGDISSISRANCLSGRGNETLLAFRRGAVILDAHYEEQRRIAFSNRNYQTVHAVHARKAYTCGFIVYKLFNHVALLDPTGTELWRTPKEANSGRPIDGVQYGDIDGDRRSEFVIYARYREGIVLVNESGKTLWKHPVFALGHLAMGDVRGNGKQEIIYSNANNANRATVFKTLDARGTMVGELELPTASYEFALIRWPGTGRRPNILLTEENSIRIVDLKGKTVVQLDAPGCRSFGKVKAITVAFRKNKPAHLAVRKLLHPDLAVLYVYDADRKLVYQETEERRGSTQPALAKVRGDKKGVEKLLVGTERNNGAVVVEYALAQP